jgi:hypothetical protein
MTSLLAGIIYIGAYLDGDIKDNNIVIMASINGAQLYEDKESDCWIAIWIIINLSPHIRYCNTHVIPAAFIPDQKKPKHIDLYMVVGIHHLSALQKEGLQLWDCPCNKVFRADLYLLFTIGNIFYSLFITSLHQH